jgi:prolyl-tRNA synthetase
VFQLGTKYSRALGATCLDGDGRPRPYVMGCYGIGVNRIAAAVVERFADESGIVWPPAIAPYEVVVIPLDMSEQRIVTAAEAAYTTLLDAGMDVILDDRSERPGVKFHDADLIGFPLRVVVGKGFLKTGQLELQLRRDGSKVMVGREELAEKVQAVLVELRAPIGQATDTGASQTGP